MRAKPSRRGAVHCELPSSRAFTPPRVCAVSYLNTLPLVWGMLHGEQKQRFDLSFALPSECADRLADGRADIGIVPSAELLRLDLEIVRGTGIASEGPVRSILLIAKTSLANVRTLAADTSSRTSVQLARIILQERYGASPMLLPMAPNLDAMLKRADAALIIGDPALRIDVDTLRYEALDLGQEWFALTGTPMVFAVWAARRGLTNPGIEAEFAASCTYGLAQLPEIAKAAESERDIPRALALRYLQDNLRVELGPREYEGLDLFLRMVRELRVAAVAS